MESAGVACCPIATLPEWQPPLRQTPAGPRSARRAPLQGVRNSAALRAAAAEVEPEVVAFQLRLGQSKPLYEALKAVKASPSFGRLTAAQQVREGCRARAAQAG